MTVFIINVPVYSQELSEEQNQINQNKEYYQAKIKNLYRKRNIEIRSVPRSDMTGLKIMIINNYDKLIRTADKEKGSVELHIRKKYQKNREEKGKIMRERERKEELLRSLGSGL